MELTRNDGFGSFSENNDVPTEPQYIDEDYLTNTYSNSNNGGNNSGSDSDNSSFVIPNVNDIIGLPSRFASNDFPLNERVNREHFDINAFSPSNFSSNNENSSSNESNYSISAYLPTNEFSSETGNLIYNNINIQERSTYRFIHHSHVDTIDFRDYPLSISFAACSSDTQEDKILRRYGYYGLALFNITKIKNLAVPTVFIPKNENFFTSFIKYFNALINKANRFITNDHNSESENESNSPVNELISKSLIYLIKLSLTIN